MKYLKIITKLILITLTTIVVSSCENQLDFTKEQKTTTTSGYSVEGTRISAENALAELSITTQLIYPENKHFINNMKSNIDVVCLEKHSNKLLKSTSSNEVLDTLLYLVNFGNDEGFAILSADTRLEIPVFCITEKGSISPDDFIQENQIINTENDYGVEDKRLITSLVSNKIQQINIKNHADNAFQGYTKYSAWTDSLKYGPFIKINYCQQEPYNRYCPIKNGQRTLVGCVAIAITQIMQANEYATTIGEQTINWKNFKTTGWETEANKNSIAQVCRTIADQCNMIYGIDGSSSNIINAKNCLKNYFGYKNLNITYSVNEENILPMLKQGLSIYCRGYDALRIVGHAWVLDGGLFQRRRCRSYYNPTGSYLEYFESRFFVHCNWGWNGSCNGYYVLDMFDLSDGPIIVDDDLNTNNKERNYTNTQIITYEKGW